ncbi:MAG: hypothetical protein KKA42_12245, partial [candidate division Zixibacteria bacterium]|nr:hypothetical protein [candidate division Zixibacteria bacterium]
MTDLPDTSPASLVEELAAAGYWPARAARQLAEGKFSNAVQICKEHLAAQPDLISGRLVYATALFRAGQRESASEQYHQVLARDPEN